MQVCRKSYGECDVPEYCTGKDSKCPTNAYAPKTLVRHLPAIMPSPDLHRHGHTLSNGQTSCRQKLGIMEDNLSVSAPFRKDLRALVEVVSSTMADEYAAVDALISKGLISWEFLPYIFVRSST